MIDLVKMFEGEKGEQQNALYTSLVNASQKWTKADLVYPDDHAVYPYLDEIPKTSLIVELVDHLNELGFKIIKDE